MAGTWQRESDSYYWYNDPSQGVHSGPYWQPTPDGSPPGDHGGQYTYNVEGAYWQDSSGNSVNSYDQAQQAQPQAYSPGGTQYQAQESQQQQAAAQQQSQPGTAPAPGSGLSAQDQSAKATIQGFMLQFGLPQSLGDWAWERYLELGPGSETQIMLELRARPEYEARFPAMAALSAKGHAMSEQEYVNYERSAANIFSYAGLAQFATPAYLTSIIANEVSLDELSDRIRNGYEKVIEAPPEVRQQFADWFGPNGDAALAGWFLDASHTEPYIKDAVQTAQAGGYGKFFGFDLSQAGAHLIGQIAPSAQALISGYQQAIQYKPLTYETISETSDLTQDQTVEAAFGTGGTALEAFRQRLESRAAMSRGGGGALQTEKGVVGAGSAGQ